MSLSILVFLLTNTTPFDSGRLSFSINVRGIENPYKIMTYTVMPGEELVLTLKQAKTAPSRAFTIEEHHTGLGPQPFSKNWTFPARKKPGHHPITITQTQTQETMQINIFVKTPLIVDKKGFLNGYHIGNYPDIPLNGRDIYKAPPGIIEIQPDMEDLWLSPHFQLKQFICKQNGGYPKYILVRTRLLLKLEFLLQLVNTQGYPCATFNIMSGYRTPFYNKSIGNVRYSRHQWGGAADIFIDENPKDGILDDLNNDGQINVEDAALLYRLVDKASYKEDFKVYIGGLGQYKENSLHGPFIHIDVRGFRARWGD